MKNANDFSGYGNEVLYRMCAKQPAHKDEDIIASKIWIIGRAYAATIERGAGKQKKGTDFCRDIVAPAIRRKRIDKWIKKVSSIKRLTNENISESLRCHKKLMDLFREITGGRTKRSLASKYLHFHVRHAFFIYDSRADKEIKHIRLPRKNPLRSHEVDNKYADFCARCLIYRDKLEDKLKGKKVTPRRLDMELLNFVRFFHQSVSR